MDQNMTYLVSRSMQAMPPHPTHDHDKNQPRVVFEHKALWLEEDYDQVTSEEIDEMFDPSPSIDT